eukprot:6903724-Pyramimonas_sp.AAC.1
MALSGTLGGSPHGSPRTSPHCVGASPSPPHPPPPPASSRGLLRNESLAAEDPSQIVSRVVANISSHFVSCAIPPA